ncbi:MAG: ribosome silencing factor [Bdellovibrionales bacterium]
MRKKTEKDLNLNDLKDLLVDTLDAQKAEDIHSIDLKGTGFPADYMIIASGRSARQVVGLAENIIDKLASLDIKEVKKEGMSAGDWVILDTGDIILHLFRPEVRLFYNIEKMWETDTPPLSTIA